MDWDSPVNNNKHTRKPLIPQASAGPIAQAFTKLRSVSPANYFLKSTLPNSVTVYCFASAIAAFDCAITKWEKVD